MNVSIRRDLAEEAKAYQTNVSALLERALDEEHRARRQAEWRKANHEAIREANEELAASGLWSDGLRLV